MKVSGILVLCFLISICGFICGGGCGNDKQVCIGEGGTECYTFEQYGLFDGKKENPKVEYDVITGNVVWAIILSETALAPIIVVGWYLYEPVGPKNKDLAGVPGAKD